jgi:hypothetical protein
MFSRIARGFQKAAEALGGSHQHFGVAVEIVEKLGVSR